MSCRRRRGLGALKEEQTAPKRRAEAVGPQVRPERQENRVI